jgi:hypothetical protein
MVTLVFTFYYDTAKDIFNEWVSKIFHIPVESVPYYALGITFGFVFVLASVQFVYSTWGLISNLAHAWTRKRDAKSIDSLLKGIELGSRLELAVLYALYKSSGLDSNAIYVGLSSDVRKAAKTNNVLEKVKTQNLIVVAPKGKHEAYYITTQGLARLREVGLLKDKLRRKKGKRTNPEK